MLAPLVLTLRTRQSTHTFGNIFLPFSLVKKKKTKGKEKKIMDWRGGRGNNAVTVDGRVCTGSTRDMMAIAPCLRAIASVLAEIRALTCGGHVVAFEFVENVC